MRTLIVLAVIALHGCGKQQPENPSLQAFEAESRVEFAAEQERERAKFASIKYPECSEIWNEKKLSTCGNKILQITLTACIGFAGEKLGGSPAIIDQWTGDSWQMRAGPAARPIEERGKYLMPSDMYLETFAYAKGDGTDAIGSIMCDLNSQLRLTGVMTV